MIYLIGGPARCGKSKLAEQIRKHTDGHVIAGDAVVASLHAMLKPEWLPDLFEHSVKMIDHMHIPEEKVDRLRRRDKVAWDFYETYIKTAQDDAPNDDILIEGNLWPDFVKTLSFEHKAVFLIDTSPEQAGRLMRIRDANGDNDWMKRFSDKELKTWAEFNAIRSQRYKKLCEQYGYSYFDIAKLGIEEAADEAFHALLSRVRYNSIHKPNPLKEG
jgi:2-phosphoglycerate kinase